MNCMARSVEAMCNRQEVVDARGWANLELASKGRQEMISEECLS